MKINLNGHILSSRLYLYYLHDNRHVHHVDYEKYTTAKDEYWQRKYPALFDLYNSNEIDIYPYLYTLDCITPHQLSAFKRFFVNYLRKTDNMAGLGGVGGDGEEVNNGDNADKDKTLIFNIASQSLDQLILLILTMQYYFL